MQFVVASPAKDSKEISSEEAAVDMEAAVKAGSTSLTSLKIDASTYKYEIVNTGTKPFRP